MQKSNATLVLIIGIVSIVICGCLPSPVAWIMGNNTLAAMRSGQMDSSDEAMANVGRILGIIGTILLIIGALFWILAIAGVVALGGAAAAAS